MLNELFVFNPIFLDLKRTRSYCMCFFPTKTKAPPWEKNYHRAGFRQTSPWDPGPEHWTRQNLVKDQFYSIRVPFFRERICGSNQKKATEGLEFVWRICFFSWGCMFFMKICSVGWRLFFFLAQNHTITSGLVEPPPQKKEQGTVWVISMVGESGRRKHSSWSSVPEILG